MRSMHAYEKFLFWAANQCPYQLLLELGTTWQDLLFLPTNIVPAILILCHLKSLN